MADFAIFQANSTEYTSNGLGILNPISATVTEEAGGSYECEITVPVTTDNKWRLLQNQRVIRMPTPAIASPALTVVHGESTPSQGIAIYKANQGWIREKNKDGEWVTRKAPIAVRDKPSETAKQISILQKDAEVTQIGEKNNFLNIITKSGIRGWSRKDLMTKVRDLPHGTQNEWSEYVPMRQTRDQLFRLYEVEESEDGSTVTARGRHIFYDLLFNSIPEYKPDAKKTMQTILDELAEAMHLLYQDYNNFDFYTDITKKYQPEFSMKNMVEVLLEKKTGLRSLSGAELLRDNWDVYLLNKVRSNQNRGVTLRYAKNLLGVSVRTNDQNVITRLCPMGYDKEGAFLLISNDNVNPPYIDSPNINNYPFPRVKVWLESSLKVGSTYKDDNGDEHKMTRGYVIARLRERAQEKLDEGCDQPSIEMTVKFQDLGNTEEYQQYKDLQQIYLYDYIKIIHEPRRINTLARVRGYVYNCITKQYDEISLGNVEQTSAALTINGANIAGGTVGGVSLAAGSVDNLQLQNLSVTAAKIEDASITTAKIALAAITTALIEDAAITNAKIGDAEISIAKIHDFSAEVAAIANANIQSAWINELAADAAEIARAQIQSANISVAQITDLTSMSAQIAQAIVDKASIASAQISDLQAGVAALDWASMQTLNAQIASIANANIAGATIHAAQIDDLNTIDATIAQAIVNKATISSAQIANAEIDWLKIKHGLITARIVGDQMYIDKLAVNSAQMVDLTVGQLCVRASDDNYYNLTVDLATGYVTAAQTTVTQSEISAGETSSGKHIIETDLTVNELSTSSALMTEALINKLTAYRIEADQLFARQAVIDQVNARIIQNDTVQLIAEQTDDLDDRQSAAELRLDGAENQIQLRVTSDEFNTFKSSYLSQTDEHLQIAFDEIRAAAEEAGVSAETLNTLIHSYFAFASDGTLTIGRSDSPFKVTIDNSQLTFWQGTVPVAYISNNELKIRQAEIENRFRLGNLEAVVDQTNGKVIVNYQ